MKQILDGCTAAAHVAYALSDIATIYPITPVASMGETADKWAIEGRTNVFGAKMQVKEMESELGAAGATHGALAGGALATTFTASQGLLLMIPNMYKIAGELLPAVFHVGSRSIATHALNIFGDHQDVMACRATGFAMLASATVQETMDLALVSHLAAIKGRVPVLHFFDGWRTSNELSTIDVIDYDTIRTMIDFDAVRRFRERAMNPMHPDLRGSAQNPDVYFQNREAQNRYYDGFPDIVEHAMSQVAAATGRQYHIFDYYGDPKADVVAVAIGSSTEVLKTASKLLNNSGKKTGVVSVRLFRPFKAESFMSALPPTVRTVVVLDRTKEPGSQGEPLLLDVATAIHEAGLTTRVIGGRYGLSSKEFDPAMACAVFNEAYKTDAKRRFTVGINDDVTHLSLQIGQLESPTAAPDVKQCIFYGMGSDGTVGATKQAAHILADEDNMYAQAYFQYSAKKSGGYTVSQLRFGPHPIQAAYSIESADYVACNKDTYVRRFKLTENIRKGGIFVLNSSWTTEEMNNALPAEMRRDIARKKLKFYNIDAISIARQVGLGVRINVIMETIFFKLINALPFDKATDALKKLVTGLYMHEGGDIVDKNLKAIDLATSGIKEITYPADWIDAEDEITSSDSNLPGFIKNVARPCDAGLGNQLPVSAFTPDGTMPMGTTAYEKRGIAIDIPQWDPDKCVECTDCSLVCSHAAIRPVLSTDAELADAPAEFIGKPSRLKLEDGSPLQFRIQVFPSDCTGCGSCVTICPGHALTMQPVASQMELQSKLLDFASTIPEKDNLMPATTVLGSQLHRPLLEFSGACGGCGETPYVKLLTQLFGPRMVIANATGCSSIWGANYPSNAYCTDRNGHGPAWGNSLFEDNAEYGYGIASAIDHRRNHLLDVAKQLQSESSDEVLSSALQAWIDAFDDDEKSQMTGDKLIAVLRRVSNTALCTELIENADMLGKKSVWAIGGDGWAYDIGFAGLDHVLAQNININLMVMDTECYSNTGGQTSKATPLGAVMKYAADGKRTYKKDLGRMMMTYGNIYVAQISLGANYQQAIRALTEAEAYPGPSIVIAYCPCINHGIRAGMSHAIVEEREAVRCGYWQLYRYNPLLAMQGKEPLTLDMAAPDGKLIQFINGEDRYADLRMVDPKSADILQPELQKRTDWIYSTLMRQTKS